MLKTKRIVRDGDKNFNVEYLDRLCSTRKVWVFKRSFSLKYPVFGAYYYGSKKIPVVKVGILEKPAVLPLSLYFFDGFYYKDWFWKK